MIVLRHALAAETLIRDADTNNVSAINLIEELATTRYPAIFAKVAFLFIHERTLSDAAVLEGVVGTLRLDDEQIARVEIRLDFQQQTRTRTLLTLNGVPVAHPGVLRLILEHNGKTLGEISFRAILRTEEELRAIQQDLRARPPATIQASKAT